MRQANIKTNEQKCKISSVYYDKKKRFRRLKHKIHYLFISEKYPSQGTGTHGDYLNFWNCLMQRHENSSFVQIGKLPSFANSEITRG